VVCGVQECEGACGCEGGCRASIVNLIHTSVLTDEYICPRFCCSVRASSYRHMHKHTYKHAHTHTQVHCTLITQDIYTNTHIHTHTCVRTYLYTHAQVHTTHIRRTSNGGSYTYWHLQGAVHTSRGFTR